MIFAPIAVVLLVVSGCDRPENPPDASARTGQRSEENGSGEVRRSSGENRENSDSDGSELNRPDASNGSSGGGASNGTPGGGASNGSSGGGASNGSSGGGASNGTSGGGASNGSSGGGASNGTSGGGASNGSSGGGASNGTSGGRPGASGSGARGGKGELSEQLQARNSSQQRTLSDNRKILWEKTKREVRKLIRFPRCSFAEFGVRGTGITRLSDGVYQITGLAVVADSRGEEVCLEYSCEVLFRGEAFLLRSAHFTERDRL